MTLINTLMMLVGLSGAVVLSELRIDCDKVLATVSNLDKLLEVKDAMVNFFRHIYINFSEDGQDPRRVLLRYAFILVWVVALLLSCGLGCWYARTTKPEKNDRSRYIRDQKDDLDEYV